MNGCSGVQRKCGTTPGMSDAVNRQLERAAQLLMQGRLPAALEEYRRIVHAVPGELSARQKIAEILARQGQVQAAGWPAGASGRGSE